MSTARTAFIGLAVLHAAGAVAQSNPAADLLRKSMGRTFGSAIISIIVQRDPSGDGTFQQLKVERTRDGILKRTVVRPLRMQGIESLDDGRRTTVYLPDDRLVIDQESEWADSGDIENRMRLAQANYAIRFNGKASIAGRKALCIEAAPRHQAMALRRYFVDEKTGYPLRMETSTDEGETILMFDTKHFELTDKLDASQLQIRPLGQVARVTYKPQSRFPNAAAVRSALGFMPLMPRELPMGFKVQGIQDVANAQLRSVAIRMTDGLVRATMYQWQAAEGQPAVKGFMNRTSHETRGVRLTLVSDLDEENRAALLEAFLDQARMNSPVAVGRALAALGRWDRPLPRRLGTMELDPPNFALPPLSLPVGEILLHRERKTEPSVVKENRNK